MEAWGEQATVFECAHPAHHKEEAVDTYWNAQLQTPVDVYSEVNVCDDCDITLEQDCE